MDSIDPDKIGEISNEKLQKELVKHGKELSIGPVTTETRNVYEKMLKDVLAANSSELSDSDLSLTVNKPELVLQSKEVEADVYYGLFIPNGCESQDPDIKKVYTDRSKCLTFLKRFPGSRFKGFPTYDKALCFSEYGPIVSCVPPSQEKVPGAPFTPPVSGEKASPFRGPKSQELVKFRKAIEQGNVQYFDECVNNNPRFLVSSGDTPAILQEGARYNALHIACRHKKSQFCKKILLTVGNPEFFQRLYPDDALETAERRTSFLVDLYLNTPDKGFNETPLHFASKHGAVECVKVLLSYSVCDKSVLNKYNESPFEVICTRLRNVPNEELKQKIKSLFDEQYYVPVLRDEDNCMAPCVGTPWSPIFGAEPSPPASLSAMDPNNCCSPINPLFQVKGYAGPMSPQKADSFYSRWKKSVVPSPSRNTKGKMAALRISDHEKGLERVGRDLASEFSVDWAEYWDFLGTFANLMSMEGLSKLEEHLRNKYREVVQQRNREESQHTLTSLPHQSFTDSVLESSKSSGIEGDVTNADTTRSSLSSIGELCQNLEALRLNASLSPNPDVDNMAKRPVLDSTLRLPSSPDPVTPSNNNLNDSKDLLNTVTERYNFAVQSCRISSQRIATILSDISRRITSHVGPDFQTARTLRNKVKQEVTSLRTVLCKCLTFSNDDSMDFAFAHLFLSAKAAENLMENVALSNIYLVYETLKLLLGNFGSFEESSSDEEDEAPVREDLSDRERLETLTHFACVVQKLETALQVAIQLMKEGKEEETINLNLLDDCRCPWRQWNVGAGLSSSRTYPVDVKKLRESINNNDNDKKTGSGGRFSRAHSFLHRVLFGNKEDQGGTDKVDNKRTPEVHKVFESVVRNLSFEEDKEEDTEEEEDKENEEEEDKEDTAEEEEEDTESFTSAVSSLDDDFSLATPEEEVQVYINGGEATKDDLDVFVAIGGLSVDESVYPRVAEWLKLVESHSQATRESWPSSCCGNRQVPPPSLHTPSPLANHKEVKKKLFPQSPI